jgi:hypothetical protein
LKKNRIIIIMLAAFGTLGLACSKSAPPANQTTDFVTTSAAPSPSQKPTQNPNPQNDKNIQKGYDDTKKEIEDRRADEARKNENFEVHESGEPRRDVPTPPSSPTPK